MSTKAPIEVKDQATADSFKALGIDAIVKGATAPAGDDVVKLKEQIDTLTKAVTDKDAEIETLKKSSGTGDNKDLDAKFVAIGTIQKGIVDQLGELKAQMEGVTTTVEEKLTKAVEDITAIANESAGRKSTGNGGGAPIKKAFEVDEKSGKKKLSKAIHQREIETLLGELSEAPDTKKHYTDAVMRYESSRSLTKATITDLYDNHDIEIVD